MFPRTDLLWMFSMNTNYFFTTDQGIDTLSQLGYMWMASAGLKRTAEIVDDIRRLVLH
jgi:hypothetical protein